jgi:GNAT superfamily N-acetyltransferase
MDPWKKLGYSDIGLMLYLDRADPALHRYVLESQGAIAGIMSVRWPWLAGPFIEIMAVLPHVQRSGLGGMAVGWVVEQAERLGGNVWATTSDFNAKGRAFWSRMGFEELAPMPDLIRPGFGELLLRRAPARG